MKIGFSYIFINIFPLAPVRPGDSAANPYKTECVMKKEEKMVTLRRFSTYGEAMMTRTLLESAGIESFIKNEYMSNIYPSLDAVFVELEVRSSDIRRAERFLNAEPVRESRGKKASAGEKVKQK